MGFTPREREGLIILACVVAACFCLEPMVGYLGCGRGSGDEERRDAVPVVQQEVGDTLSSGDVAVDEAEWIRRDERSAIRLRSDSIRRERRDSARVKKGGKSARKRTMPASQDAPARRSLRDERIP